MIFRRPYIVKRKSSGSISDGKFTDGAISDISITASVQPLKSQDIQQLPEGRRNSKLYYVFTSTALNTVGTANPDSIVIDGEIYEVDKKDSWQNGVINHYKYLVYKV
jgi:hypothetical protein